MERPTNAAVSTSISMGRGGDEGRKEKLKRTSKSKDEHFCCCNELLRHMERAVFRLQGITKFWLFKPRDWEAKG